MTTEDRHTVEEVLDIIGVVSGFVRDGDDTGRRALPSVTMDAFTDAGDPLSSCRKHYLRLFAALEAYFDFGAEPGEWEPLARNTTPMNEVAEFIAARARRPALQPLRVLGQPCMEAGVFEEIRRLCGATTDRTLHLGPSTRILDVLSSKQCESLAWRLHRHFPGIYRHKPLWRRDFLGKASGFSLLGMVLFTVLSALVVTERGPALLLGASCACVAVCLAPVVLLTLIASAIVERRKGPFADNIRTFKDLVRALMKVPGGTLNSEGAESAA